MTAGSFRVIGIGAETRDEFFVVPEFSAGEHVTQALASCLEDRADRWRRRWPFCVRTGMNAFSWMANRPVQ
jgi:hypothetical protein